MRVKFAVPFIHEVYKGSGLRDIEELDVIVQLDPKTKAVAEFFGYPQGRNKEDVDDIFDDQGNLHEWVHHLDKKIRSSFVKLDQNSYDEDRTDGDDPEVDEGASKVLYQLQDLKNHGLRPLMLWCHYRKIDMWVEEGIEITPTNVDDYFLIPLAEDHPLQISHQELAQDPLFGELMLWKWYPQENVDNCWTKQRWEVDDYRNIIEVPDCFASNLVPYDGGGATEQRYCLIE